MTKRFVPFVCLNCDDGIVLPTTPKLYCSVGCSQEAELIRYARRTGKDGRANQPDVMEAIQIRLAHVMAGGYQKRERYIPPYVRLAVLRRDQGQCRLCGQPGTEIDHIEGASSRLQNLQLLCHACHNDKTLASVVYVYPGDEGYEVLRAKHAEFWRRVDAKRPVRRCDDEENWKKVYGTLLAECR
jgi:hypothetical protein